MGFFGYVSVIMKEPMGESKVRIYGQDDERRKYSISKPPPNRTKIAHPFEMVRPNDSRNASSPPSPPPDSN
jgi:hypothetical protein